MLLHPRERRSFIFIFFGFLGIVYSTLTSGNLLSFIHMGMGFETSMQISKIAYYLNMFFNFVFLYGMFSLLIFNIKSCVMAIRSKKDTQSMQASSLEMIKEHSATENQTTKDDTF